MSLANGYLGINLAAVGPFFEVEQPVNGDVIGGWPLFDRRQTFSTIAGFWDSQPETNMTNFEWLYQYGGESVISGVPHWAGLHVQVGDELLDASVSSDQISDFSSTVDFAHGMMEWKYTWTPSSGEAIGIWYTMFVHKLHVNQAAVQLQMTSKSNTKVSVIDVLQGDGAERTNLVGKGYDDSSPMIWAAVSPWEIDNVSAYIYSSLLGDASVDYSSRSRYTVKSVIGGNSSSIGQSMDVHLSAGKTSTVTKYIGGASSDAFDDTQTTAWNAAKSGSKAGYSNLYKSHAKEWEYILNSDTVDIYSDPSTGELPDDQNVIELAITAVTNPYHLLQNTVGANAVAAAGGNDKLTSSSISVGGLGSDAYAGWIFWDAEVWMAPGLVVSHPDAAKQIAQYRVDRFQQAQANIKTAYQSSQNETGKFSPNGAIFPWVSGRFGNCTAAGPCFDYEYHINGDIGLELYNYYVATGDSAYFKKELLPIYDAIAQMYADVVTYNETAGKYYLYNATDPDEYANFQTNVGYTMVLMHTHLDTANTLRARLGMPENETWANISSLIEIPVDKSANIILEYQAMNGSVQVKQADVVLVDDFLDYPNPYTLSDLDFYAGKQSPLGPGMTYGVFSIIANEYSPSGCSSYTYHLYSSKPYTRGPWFQFSEQLIDDYQIGGTHPAFPFLTGIGGANRVAIYGYLGLRLMLDTLNVDPNLPPQIPSLKYRQFYWQGWPIDATSTQTHTVLKRPSNVDALDGANQTFASAAIPVTIGIKGQSDVKYHLSPGGSITIPNRQIANVKTVPGNLAQCRPVHASGGHAIGQFPLSAVDGAVSTKWQPTSAKGESSIRVSLPEPYVPVTELKFDWAQAPPVSYKVIFSNSSDGSNSVTVSSNDNVKVSNPYIASKADEIVAYASNTTNVTLSAPVYSGKYATLTISGNHALGKSQKGVGASVAEFAIVASSGEDLAKRSIEVV
jgi:trehalose/maltose hydrolase-like predicted phosphorylase